MTDVKSWLVGPFAYRLGYVLPWVGTGAMAILTFQAVRKANSLAMAIAAVAFALIYATAVLSKHSSDS